MTNRSTLSRAGLLGVRRPRLVFGAMVFTAMLATVPALPASADVVQDEQYALSAQSLVVGDSVEEAAIDRANFGATEPSVVQAPVDIDSRISDGYGPRVAPCAGCSTFHKGVDLLPGEGNSVAAIADGTVAEVGNPSGELGVYVVIDHVIDGKKISSTYGHMQVGSLTLQVGDSVSRGQVVGLVGSTGQSTGPHLHFEIKLGGVTPVDPMAWLRAHVTS